MRERTHEETGPERGSDLLKDIQCPYNSVFRFRALTWWVNAGFFVFFFLTVIFNCLKFIFVS